MKISLKKPFFPLMPIKIHFCASVLLLLSFATLSDGTVPGVLHDYCDEDYFRAECPPDQIVVIEEARFGRMKLGTCLTADFGYLNCFGSVLEVLDRRCSGRQNCNFLVSLLNEFRRFCTKQLPGYLQARYTCQSVMVPDVDCCQAPEDKVFIAANVGILSNYMTQTSGCGGIDCPWVLQSSPGQLFNISLLDFSTYKGTLPNAETLRATSDHRCNVYAKIKEEASGASVSVCSGVTRHKHLYTTTSSTVEIQIVNTGDNGEEPTYFALSFTAFGCPNPNPPSGALVKRQGDRAIITCESNNVAWEILCDNGVWHGDLGKCSENGAEFIEGDDYSYFTREVYLVLVIAIAFVLAVAIVTAGVVCLYRHWARIPSNARGHPAQLPSMQPRDGTYLASEFNYTLSGNNKGYETAGYSHHRHDKYPRPDHNTMPRTTLDQDKGYYSGRTYESPICVENRAPLVF